VSSIYFHEKVYIAPRILVVTRSTTFPDVTVFKDLLEILTEVASLQAMAHRMFTRLLLCLLLLNAILIVADKTLAAKYTEVRMPAIAYQVFKEMHMIVAEGVIKPEMLVVQTLADLTQNACIKTDMQLVFVDKGTMEHRQTVVQSAR